MIPVPEFDEEQYLFFATKQGIVKRTSIQEYRNIRTNGIIALTLRGDDELIGVKLTSNDEDIIIGTRDGMLIRFKESDIRVMGRTAGGVIGIRLREEDYVIGMDLLNEKHEVLIVTEKGYGKRTPAEEYRIQTRGGLGLKTAQITERNGKLVAMKSVEGTEDIMIITGHGIIIRMDINDISVFGRNTQGVRLIRIDEGEFVATVAKVVKEDDLLDEDEEDDQSE